MLPWSKRSEQTTSPDKTIGRTKPNPTEKCSKQLRWECPSCSPNFNLEIQRLHSGAELDRPETTEIPELPPIPEVVWQQPSKTITDQANLNITNIDSTSKTTVASQTLPPKGSQPQNYVVIGDTLQEIKQGTNQYRSLTATRTALPISKIQNST